MDKLNALVNGPPYLFDADAERIAARLSAEDIKAMQLAISEYLQAHMDNQIRELATLGQRRSWQSIQRYIQSIVARSNQ